MYLGNIKDTLGLVQVVSSIVQVVSSILQVISSIVLSSIKRTLSNVNDECRATWEVSRRSDGGWASYKLSYESVPQYFELIDIRSRQVGHNLGKRQ